MKMIASSIHLSCYGNRYRWKRVYKIIGHPEYKMKGTVKCMKKKVGNDNNERKGNECS